MDCRSFGPAIISGTYPNFWVFWVGPLSGAIISVPFYLLFRAPVDTVPVEPDEDEVEEKLTKEGAKKVDALPDVTTAGYVCINDACNAFKYEATPRTGLCDCVGTT